jgi:hypothetical protein
MKSSGAAVGFGDVLIATVGPNVYPQMLGTTKDSDAIIRAIQARVLDALPPAKTSPISNHASE